MSTVNATTIFADLTTANVVIIGNASSNINISTSVNSTATIWGSNVTINSTSISVGNSTSKTVLNANGLITNTFILNGVTLSTPNNYNIVNVQTFTATGWSQWTNPYPNSNSLITVHLWGGGGSGNTTGASGGGGGSYIMGQFLANECNAVCNVFVGSGGTAGSNGTASLFYANSTITYQAFGGVAANSTAGGGGGGQWATGTAGVGGEPQGGATGAPGGDALHGGGGGGNAAAAAGGVSVYGGGGGGITTGAGGKSLYGGGGGSNGAALGASAYGGAGGNNTTVASARGGGGGGGAANNDGGRGEIIVITTRVG